MFANPLPVDNKYCLLNRDNLKQHVQIQLSHKRKSFSQVYFALSAFLFNFEHFQKKIALIADVIFKLRTPKNVVR